MFSCLFIPMISSASSPKESYQAEDVYAQSSSQLKTKAIKPSGYGASDASAEQIVWEHIQAKIQIKLQPIADVILYKSTIQEKIYQQFPPFKKYATATQLLSIKKKCIEAVAKKMIYELDWNHAHTTDSTSWNECARELQEEAVVKSSKLSWALLGKISTPIKQEIDEVSIQEYATMLPEFYGALESNWGYTIQDQHKAQSYAKMKELHKKYNPTDALSDKELQDMFEKYYAQFKKLMVNKK